MSGRFDSDASVVVIGGGVAGLALLHALSVMGVDALLVENGATGAHGASSLPAALLNPHRGRTGRASELDTAGLAYTLRLADRLENREDGSGGGGVYRGGVLRVASSPRQARLWRDLRGPRFLTPTDFPPHVKAPHGGMLIEDGGWLEPSRFLAAMRRRAVARGARIVEGATALSVTDAEGSGSSVPGPLMRIATSSGTFGARDVVLAIGAYDAGALRLPRLEHAPGLAVTFDLDDHSPSLVATQEREARLLPLAGAVGIVFVGSTAVVSGAAHHGDERDVERLRSSASWFVPSLADAPVAAVWRGVRARRPSGTPVIRRLRAGVTLFGALGGRGFLCGPLLAQRLAERLAGRAARR